MASILSAQSHLCHKIFSKKPRRKVKRICRLVRILCKDDSGIDRVKPQNLNEALKKAYNEVPSWRTTANIETWTHKLSQRRFGWTGHVARMNNTSTSVLLVLLFIAKKIGTPVQITEVRSTRVSEGTPSPKK